MKKVMIVIAAFVMSIGVYSFSSSHDSKTVLAQKWYDFVGDDPNDPLDYVVHVGAAPSCNSGSDRCAVKAEKKAGAGDYPNLQDPLIEIRNKP